MDNKYIKILYLRQICDKAVLIDLGCLAYSTHSVFVTDHRSDNNRVCNGRARSSEIAYATFCSDQ